MDSSPEQPQPETPAAPQIDQYKLQRFQDDLKNSQNLALAILGGGIGALIGAVLWAVITVLTDSQIGFVAIGVGFLVGTLVRLLGKGLDQVYGIVGALWSLVGTVIGNIMAITVIVAQGEEVPILDVAVFLLTTPAAVVEILSATFSFVDLLFYGLAIYYGYRLSFRRITEKELERLRTDSLY